MSERMVEIPVFKEVRDRIKIQKGVMSYNQFLKNIADGHTMIVGGKL